MTSILIADDHPMIRSAVALLLEGSDFEMIGQATDANQALGLVEERDPDMVILDLAMPGGSGLEVLRRIRGESDDRPIIILTAEIDEHQLAEALALSVDGIVLKNSDPAYLIDCLRGVHAGERWIDPELKERVESIREGTPAQSLSPRERQLAILVAQGLRNREIATELGITEGTVKVYLHSIFDKLGIGNRTELAMRFRS
jgi:two-component system, NarL family, nitrate/nitrite response regulator NarL